MIIPINNGNTITPIYIPPVVSFNSGVLQQTNTNTQYNEPTLVHWILLGVILIFIITIAAYFINFLKVLFGGKNE